MSHKHVSILAIAVAVVIAAIFLLLPEQTGDEAPPGEAAAVPGLEARVNDLDRVTVVGAGDEVLASLVRGATGWTIGELAGYPANLETLRAVLGGLATARALEPKTDNPDYYDRLGVEDVAGENAGGLRLDLGAGETASWSVIVGNEAPARGGHYLRLADAAGSVLADFDADVPASAAGWAESTVIDLMAGEVAEARIRHPDGETVTARKVSADESDFSLVELPEGREAKSAWAVNSLGSALSTLDFETVRRADEFDWSEAVELRVLRFDGLAVTARLLRDGDTDWLRLAAAAPPEPATTGGEATVDVSVGDEVATDAPAVEPSPATNTVREAADTINARVAGWAYGIPAYKADAMDARLEELLKEPPGEQAASGG